MTHDVSSSLEVLDWRRSVAALYRDVRSQRDPAAAHALWCARRAELFESHPASPRAGTQRLVHAAYDPDLRFTLPLDAAGHGDHLATTTGTDGVVTFRRVGTVRLPIGDLAVWWLTSYGGGVFLPMADATSGVTTYGGGRYVLDTVKGADLGSVQGRLVVDLNFAYNPSCAYDPSWGCPLAPPANVLDEGVEAGELLPQHER